MTHPKMRSSRGLYYRSCGGAKVFGGQATFDIEYGKQIVVNGRQWRFRAYGVEPGHSTPRPDAPVYIADPESKDRIVIVFATDGRTAGGWLQVNGQRSGTMCADAWKLTGGFSAATH